MRYQGTLIEWNAARGFGFVRRHGDADGKVFVHVRAFGQRGVQPAVGDILTYAMERDDRGRPRAADVAFAVSPTRKAMRGHGARQEPPGTPVLHWVATAVVLVAFAVFAWKRYEARSLQPDPARAASKPAPTAAPSFAPQPPGFACSGKQYCSQMTSCAEATFYLKHCPGTLADGDDDGIPCEDQWCGH